MAACRTPAAEFRLRILFYLLILLALLLIYSSGADPFAQFVYTNF
jgi:hypothetical protein